MKYQITAFRPTNGNTPSEWIKINVFYNTIQEVEEFREYCKKWYNVPNVDFNIKQPNN